MWLEAILTKSDVLDLFEQLAPFTIRLGDSGELTLATPADVTIDPDRGVLLSCKAAVRWSVLGIHVPVAIHTLAAVVTPVVERDGGGRDALSFKLSLDHADIAAVPSVLDEKVTARINDELSRKHVALSWRYRDLLERVFPLPAALVSTESLGLRVKTSAVKTTADALGFAVVLGVEVVRRRAAATAAAGDGSPPPRP